MRHDDERRGRAGHEGLDGLPGRDVQVVRGLVEEQQVRRLDPEDRQLQARALPAREGPDLLGDVVAAEQEAGEVRARLARRDRDGLQQRIEDRRARDGRLPQLREVAELDVVSERDRPVERRQLPGDRAQERGLACAVRPDDADPVPTLGGQERDTGHRSRLGRGGPVLGLGAPAGQVPDDHALDADDHLARTGGPGARECGARDRELASLARRLGALGLEPLEPCLMLVHLGELAVAAIPLDQLLFADDLLGLGRDVLDSPGVPLLALAVVGRVVAAERGQPAVPEFPDPVDGRVEERPVVRRDQQRAGALAQVVLQPLEGVEVEVVGRLVEQEQVGVRDDKAGQRRAGLLAAGHRGRRLGPLGAVEPEPLSAVIHPLVQRVAAQDVELVLEVRVRGVGDAAVPLEAASASAIRSRCAAPLEPPCAGPAPP